MRRWNSLLILLVLLVCPSTQALAQASWPMRQRDIHNTGRADFAVPAGRMNSGLFAAVAWQTPVPGSPVDGALSSTQMVFFDGVGPGGTDLVVGGYHWPKGVQGMDRHTGRVFWFGNPAGGESIGRSAVAFSPTGSRVYMTNDNTPGPLMAFNSATGPGTFWDNAASNTPDAGAWSPKVLPDGRVLTSNWCDSVQLYSDNGSALTPTAVLPSTCSCYPTAAAYNDSGLLRVYVASRCGFVTCYNGTSSAQLWRTNVPGGTDAAITVDPANGNLFVSVGFDDVWVIGLNKLGQPLWSGGVSVKLFDWVDGQNQPQRSQSSGAISHDGATYYFQSVGPQSNGRLYAVNTSNGSLKWSFDTQSRGVELVASSPIVTPNGVIFIGNNEGRRFYALRDDGGSATQLATIDNATGGAWNGLASASATLAPDGLLYLPVRGVWAYPYAGGPSPSGATANMFAAFDLSATPTILLPSPTGQRAFAGNASVRLEWRAITSDPQAFSHYAVYRSITPFTSVQSMTPIATITSMPQASYIDATAANGQRYYYAVTSVAMGSGERRDVAGVGPRTPHDESDLQVVTIRRTPEFPRYDVTYANQLVTEPSGFGPYWFSAANGLGGGQTAATQRWPNVGDTVAYTATIRNRGTNPWNSGVSGRWLVDGQQVSLASSASALNVGQALSFALTRTWDGQLHDIRFELLGSDARAGNNALSVSTKSVAFLSYVDRTFAEEFREGSRDYPLARSDDMIDWLNQHMTRFNQLFATAGTAKRVHFGVLEMLDDAATDPSVPTINYAVFPFRYRAGEGSFRANSGYYRPAEDIDYGLLHEMGHQLGLIDLYQLDTAPDRNQVSASGYTAPDCLMRGVSPFLSSNSAGAMTLWLDKAHGYFGQYLYSLPQSTRVRLLGADGTPLNGAMVRVYQKVDRPGLGPIITNQVKFTGATDPQGYWTLPNVTIDHALVPTTFAGDALPDNPFGYVAVVGHNGLLLLEVVHQGFTDYAWLDITELNAAYWVGQTNVATITKNLALGGPIQYWPPRDMAELNPQDWLGWADGGTSNVSTDLARRVVGAGSVKVVTDGGFDTYARYPAGLARWNLSGVQSLKFWAYAENTNSGFQNQSPWIRIRTSTGLIDLKPSSDILNTARGNWVQFVVPLAGSPAWQRTTIGLPNLTEVNGFEIHADTWGYGFTIWYDGVGVFPQPCPVDFNGSASLSVQDIFDFLAAWFAGSASADFDGQGGLAVQDIFEFLAAWFAGC